MNLFLWKFTFIENQTFLRKFYTTKISILTVGICSYTVSVYMWRKMTPPLEQEIVCTVVFHWAQWNYEDTAQSKQGNGLEHLLFINLAVANSHTANNIVLYIGT